MRALQKVAILTSTGRNEEETGVYKIVCCAHKYVVKSWRILDLEMHLNKEISYKIDGIFVMTSPYNNKCI